MADAHSSYQTSPQSAALRAAALARDGFRHKLQIICKHLQHAKSKRIHLPGGMRLPVAKRMPEQPANENKFDIIGGAIAAGRAEVPKRRVSSSASHRRTLKLGVAARSDISSAPVGVLRSSASGASRLPSKSTN